MSTNTQELYQQVEDSLNTICNYRTEGSTPKSVLDGINTTLNEYFVMLKKVNEEESGGLVYGIEYVITTLEYLIKLRNQASQALAVEAMTGKNPYEEFWGTEAGNPLTDMIDRFYSQGGSGGGGEDFFGPGV